MPAENLVGEVNRGWDYAKFLLGNERVGVAPVGAVKRVLAAAKQWAAEAGEDGETAPSSTTRWSPPGSPSSRTSCWRSS